MWIDWSHISKIYEKNVEDDRYRRKQFDRRLGLLDFTGFIRRGITVVLGPEGSGKTTLLKLTATLMMPNDGSITYQTNEGRRFIWSQRKLHSSRKSDIERLKEMIGYIPPIRKVSQDITCEESLLYLAQLRRIPNPRQRCAEMVAKWGLAGYRKTPLDQMPPPVLKRYLLAQSLLGRPKFWILDEPTLDLDDLGRFLFIEELKNGPKDRIVLLATQNMKLAEWANDIILLDSGACRRIGKKKYLTASVPEGTVAAWYKAMQTFTHLQKPVI